MSTFIDSISAKAKELYYKYGILPSVSISQAVLESGGGSSGLTRRANNLFGIKGTGTAGSIEMVTTEYINGKPEKVIANFRAYNNYAESLEDYGELIGTAKRYEGVRNAKDYKSALVALNSSGYATDPMYSAKLSEIILNNELYKLDAEVTGQEVKNPGSTTNPVIDFGGTKKEGENMGVLDTIGEWLKTAGFLFVGLVLLALGVWFLFK